MEMYLLIPLLLSIVLVIILYLQLKKKDKVLERVVLEKHDLVEAASVIGIPHPYKVEIPKAFVVLKKGYKLDDELKEDLIKHCKKNLAYYSVPKVFEQLDRLPKTMIGKVDFKKLKEDSVKEKLIKNGKN